LLDDLADGKGRFDHECFDRLVIKNLHTLSTIFKTRFSGEQEQRIIDRLGEKDEIERKYRVRYLPGQELYKSEAKPNEVADIIVDYNDPTNPAILYGLIVDPGAGTGVV
jgi:hypothetical protein